MPTSPSDLAYPQGSHCDLCAQNYDAFTPATLRVGDLNLCGACASPDDAVCGCSNPFCQV